MIETSDEPLDDKELPDSIDLDDEDEPLARVVSCPSCGAEIDEDAPQCPHCRQWIGSGLGSLRTSRKWYVRGGLYFAKVLLVNWVFWLVGGALAALVVLLGLRG